MNVIKLLLSTMFMSRKNPNIKYHNKERFEPYKVVTFTVPRLNNQVLPVYVKISKTVHQFYGDRAKVHNYIRETLKEFRILIQEYIWTQEEHFSTMRNQILTGLAKSHWDKVCDVDPVDPDAPQQDDFEQVLTNFITKIVDQETPGNVVWEHLRSLVYYDILKKHAHTPSKYLKSIKKVEKDTLKLVSVAGTEPTEDMKKDYFIRSLHESNLEWFGKYDSNGNNDVDAMNRKDITRRMDARMLSKVYKAKQDLAHKHSDYNGNNNNKCGNGSQEDGSQERASKRFKNGGGGYSKKNGNSQRGEQRGGRGDRYKKKN